MNSGTDQPRWGDSHAHYDSKTFDSDREELLGVRLPQQGVELVINMGTDLESCQATLDMAEKFPIVRAAVGIHPQEIAGLEPDWLDRLRGFLEREPPGKIVAIGEIGLDYHYSDGAPREAQIEVFSRQLELAGDYGLPVSVHDRDAHGDTMALLRKYRLAGVVHCFSGSVEMAREVVGLGMYLGIGGTVTFQNARKLVEVVREIPLERLLLETDCPYLAPVPCRGKRNDSGLLPFVAEKIGEIKEIPMEQVYNRTNETLRQVFHLS